MNIKNIFSALFGAKSDNIPEDIKAKVRELFPNAADRSYVLLKLETLWQMPLNVGPVQLAQGILVLSGSSRNEFDALFDGGFMGDPRDLLTTAEEKLGNPGHFGSTPFEPSSRVLERRINTLIAAGQISEAIQALLDAGHNDAAVLKMRWDALNVQQAEGKIDWETFTITQNRITFALLELTKPPESLANWEPGRAVEPGNPEPVAPERPKLTAEQYTQLLHLLEQDRWRDALETGKDWSPELILLHSRAQLIDRHYHMGLILETTFIDEQHRIKQALAYLLRDKDS